MAEEIQGNLTEGPILRVLMRLAVPIMASSFLSTAYSITDMAWVGSLGATAVAGIGVGGMYVWLSSGLSALTRMGGQVYAAQMLGRGRRAAAKNYAAAAVQMVLLFAVVFSVVCLAFTDPLLSFFDISDGMTMDYARVYMRISCGLIGFSFLNQTLTGLFTAQGDSQTPLKANVAGLLLNMLLDPLLILGIGPFPRLEVAGAAVATVAAQMVVTAVLLVSIVRAKEQDTILRDRTMLRPVGREYYRAVFCMGGPTALQSSLYCAISMVLTRMVGIYGAAAVATQRLGGQIESISWNTAEGFGSALNAFVGQNYGAGKMDRVRSGYRVSFFAVSLWGLVITLVFLLFPEQISEVFFHEKDAIAVSVNYFLIVGLSEAFMSVELMAMGAISGLGRTRICSAVSAVVTALRIPAAMIFSGLGLGLDGIWWALTVTSVLKGIILHGTFRYLCREKRCEEQYA